MSQEPPSPPRADSGVSSAASGISDDGGGVDSFDDLWEETMWELVLGDSDSEDEIDAQIEDLLFRAAGASRAQLRQLAAMREEKRAANEAFRRKVAAYRKEMRDKKKALRDETKATDERIKALRVKAKATRDRTNALRRGASPEDERLRRRAEFTDLLQVDVSGYTDAQRAEYYKDLDRRSKEFIGNGGSGD